MPTNEYIIGVKAKGTGKAKKQLKGVSGSLTKMAGSVALASAAFLGARGLIRTLKEGTQAWTEFEAGMAEVRTLMLDKQPMAEMRKELELLSSQTGQTLDKLTKAKYDAVSAGFTSAADSAMLLNTASKLAVGGVTDVSTSMDLLTSALNAYGLEASDSMQVSDQLFTAVRIGKTTISELAASLGTVMPGDGGINYGRFK